MKNTVGKESRDDVGHDEARPEKSQPDGKLLALVEIRQIQDDIWDEATFNEAHERTGRVKGGFTSEAALATSDDAPSAHLNGDPNIRTEFLADHLGW